MKPTAVIHRLKRKVRMLTAQKRHLVWELRAAKAGQRPSAHFGESSASGEH